MERSSITSGFDDYRSVCKEAATNEEFFKTFKQNPHYTVVLEHVNEYQGRGYAAEILNTNNLDLSKMDTFKQNDMYGTPTLHNFGEPFGQISPSTLRYIKTLSDLVKHFGSLDGLRIAEIGVGYGGQAKIILDYFNVKKYSLVDLPEANMLAKTYLSKWSYDNLEFMNFENLPEQEYDLVISNYALSECTIEMQDVYYDKILSKSKHGYMMMNEIMHENGLFNYSKWEWVAKLPNVSILDEVPKTGNDNYLFVF